MRKASKFQSVLDVARRDKAGSELTTQEKSRTRPLGKRSDPDFVQITAYIRKETHRKVKIQLLEEGEGREFSELVEDLLREWLSDRA